MAGSSEGPRKEPVSLPFIPSFCRAPELPGPLLPSRQPLLRHHTLCFLVVLALLPPSDENTSEYTWSQTYNPHFKIPF